MNMDISNYKNDYKEYFNEMINVIRDKNEE